MRLNAPSRSKHQRNKQRSLIRAAIKLYGYSSSGMMFFGKRLAARGMELTYRSYTPRPDDIFIVTYPRSGTTWVQMILYQILTDGEMNFTHIHEWSPHYEDRVTRLQSIERLPSPRVFKSHLDYKNIPKGPCKYIYVARNGMDVAISYYHYSRTHMGFKGDFAAFFDLFLSGKYNYGSWFKHVSQWQGNRRNLDVLFLSYEDLASNREEAIRKIIRFCGAELSPEKLERIMERSSFAFMKQHEDKFDQLTWKLKELNLKTGAFLRKAQVGEGKECFDREQERRFERQLEAHFGRLRPELRNILK